MSNKSNFSYFNKKNIPNPKNFSFGVVVSEWNSQITSKLFDAVMNTLLNLGVNKYNIHTFKVPGSLELIFVCNQLAESNKFDAIVCIGCILKGETHNFNYICSAVSNGIKDINLYSKTPVIFCVLTDDYIQQSFDRAGGKYGNKGVESAISAIKMANIKKKIKTLIQS